uniref:Uncharacterized protein n=1 Tax=Nelumbo nucifera TaxID=4432 RepID=A0A822XIG8_NELNU|nr:TPA_asm: hypothetical protein HUJ06_021245 [Nelumbo nucifera]
MVIITQPKVKLFNRWPFDDVQVGDISLVDYIGVVPSKHATYIPHTTGRYFFKKFRKAQCPIVERLTNFLMVHERSNGMELRQAFKHKLHWLVKEGSSDNYCYNQFYFLNDEYKN